MSEAIVVAIISLLGIVISNVLQSRKISADFEKQSELADARLEQQFALADARQEQSQAVTNQKIDELSKRVEKHNSVIERVYKLEQESAVQHEMLTSIHHRLNDMQQKIEA